MAKKEKVKISRKLAAFLDKIGLTAVPKVRTKLAVHHSSKKKDWTTPQEAFDQKNKIFKFDIDLAAEEHNKKCERYLGPGSLLGEDALKVDWRKVGRTGFCNPPYGADVIKWVKKAYEESLKGFTTVMLLAARVDTQWWHRYVEPFGEYDFVEGRYKFGGGDGDPAPFPSVWVVFHGRNRKPEVELPKIKTSIRYIVGDVRERLSSIEDKSIQTIITSPPYWTARDYGNGPREIGRDQELDQYIRTLADVCWEMRDKLKDDGTLWLNIGDIYVRDSAAGNLKMGNEEFNKGRKSREAVKTAARKIPDGLKEKDLALIPHRLILALQADGWYVRNDIVWQKVRPMPESVKDRLSSSWEHVFLLTKSKKYFCDPHAIREASVSGHPSGNSFARENQVSRHNADGTPCGKKEQWTPTEWRHARDVWRIDNPPSRYGHPAVFPEALVEKCILAGSRPGDLVLDPFAGSGTTLIVAHRLKRNSIGIDLSRKNRDIFKQRLEDEKKR